MKNANSEKLPEYFKDFRTKNLAVIGCGAVGGYIVENLIKMEIKNLVLIDFDRYEEENAIKTTSLFKPNEDSGVGKAIALAKRANELIGENHVVGIESSISGFGPMYFTKFDVVFLALDNYAAKIFFNQVWKQIPREIAPLLIFCGTNGESAQSCCLDGNDACFRCCISEEWLEDPLKRTSCTGTQYRQEDGKGEIAKTTGPASEMAANLATEQCRGFFLGHDVVNKRIMYSAYPNLSLKETRVLRRKSCPDCENYKPVENTIPLKNLDVLHSTVADLIWDIRVNVGSAPFSICVPKIEYAKILYGKIVENDFCRSCGNEIKGIYKHEFKVHLNELLCEDCKNKGKRVSKEYINISGSTINAINRDDCPSELRNCRLFDLGFTIGGFIEVIVKDNNSIDIMDGGYTSQIYYCEGDLYLDLSDYRLEG